VILRWTQIQTREAVQPRRLACRWRALLTLLSQRVRACKQASTAHAPIVLSLAGGEHRLHRSVQPAAGQPRCARAHARPRPPHR
jgi:hypothetical protein